MKGLILSVLASAALTPAQPLVSLMSSGRMAASQSVLASDWYISGQLVESCELHALGVVTDASGANLDLACAANSSVMGSVSAQVAAQGWRQRRVTVSAEIRTGDAMNVSLWLKTQRGTTLLMFDDDSEQNLLSTTRTADGWETHVITLPIAADATQLSFGVLVQGSGALAVRDLQLHVSQPGAMSLEATQTLDAAIEIVKQQTLQRDDLAWRVLEPQLRLFASGAQSAAEVYPAIKYLLSRLGDKQSLLLTPEVAVALNRVSPASSGNAGDARINVFSLPDGARLVLSRDPAESVVRTARNQVRAEALP
jgi:hypothetical protein